MGFFSMPRPLVSGLVSSRGGKDYKLLHEALVSQGYTTGAILVNAQRFVPQSRPRVFVIGTRGPVPAALHRDSPTWLHTKPVMRAASLVDGFVWWSAPEPASMKNRLKDTIDESAPFDRDEFVRLTPQNHVLKYEKSGLKYVTGYKRTRNHAQVFELRCDGLSGCLRTPGDGSSQQYVVMRDGAGLHARLMTVREAARLMGAPDTYILPDTYSEGYLAMGDAVVLPMAHWLADNLLAPLVEVAYSN